MKQRKEKIITCSICAIDFKSRSNRIWYCPICARNRHFRKNHLDYKYRLQRLLAMAKNRAKTKGLAFDLDIYYLIYLWEENQGRCALSGRLFSLDISAESQVNSNAPSLDRIVPKLGYTKGNVRLVTYHFNVAMSDFGLDALESLMKDYINGGVAH